MSDELQHPGHGAANPSSAGHGDDVVPLAITPHPISGHLLCSVLASLGVEAVVLGEHSAANITFFSAIGTTTVSVRRRDYDRAVKGLAEFMDDAGKLNPSTITRCLACGYDMKGLENNERCPECGTAWSALAQLKNTISLAAPPRMVGSEAPVQRMGVALGLVIAAVTIAGIAALVIWQLTLPGR